MYIKYISLIGTNSKIPEMQNNSKFEYQLYLNEST